jgi:hypothetical protein
MISALCCRCGRELATKGGVLLTPPEGEDEEMFDGLLGDNVVKHHLCFSCLKATLEWLKMPVERSTIRCGCGAELAECTQCGIAGEPVGSIECPVAARRAGRAPIAEYHVCSLHHGRLIAPTGPPTMHVLFEGHALCGFMAGCTPSGWPDGHQWVSIVEVVQQEGKVPPTEGALCAFRARLIKPCTPCDRCLSLASASALSRSRA